MDASTLASHSSDSPLIGRRGLLGAAAVAGISPVWLLNGCAGMVAQPVNDPPARLATFHAANRLGWGANTTTARAVWQSGYERYVAQQLKPDYAAPLPPEVQTQIDAMRIERTPLLELMRQVETQRRAGAALPTEDERKDAQKTYQQTLTALSREAASRHLLRAVYSDQQLLEHMTWFWVNHFNVHQFKGNVRVMLGDYEAAAIRLQALGRFRDLLGNVARHPAMLRYLDNDQNAVRRINENYARELLELHTLGVNGGYQQRDVQEMARVLTGFGIARYDNQAEPPANLKPQTAALYIRQGAFEFNPNRHDFGEKQVLGKTIKGRGAAELDEVLDLIVAHPATARFVSTRIATYLLSDEPPQALVERMATAFRASDGRIDATLRVLLLSPEFREAQGSLAAPKFKDPMHYVVSAVRVAYEGRVIVDTAPLQNWLNRMGQGLYNRQTPDGYPLNAAAWSSSGQLGTRFEAARALGSGLPALFKPVDAPPPPPVVPQLDNSLYRETLQASIGPDTRAAFAQAGSPQEWNALFLSSPEFMYR